MKLKQLLLFILASLATHSAQAMHQNTVDTDAAAQRAQQIADSLAAGQTIQAVPAVEVAHAANSAETNTESKRVADSAQKNTGKTHAVDREKLHAALPEDVQYNIGAFFTREAWRQKFYENATSYTMTANDHKWPPENICAHGCHALTILPTQIVQVATDYCYSTVFQVWDINKACCIKTINIPGMVSAAAINAQAIIFCDNSNKNVLMLYDRTTEKVQPIAYFEEPDSFDGIEKILTSTDGTYCILGNQKGKIITFQRQPDGTWRRLYNLQHGNYEIWSCIEDLLFDQDEKHLISMSGDNTIKIWDVATGRLEKTLVTPETTDPFMVSRLTGTLQNCVISDDGRTLVAARRAWARPIVWDVKSEQHLKIEDCHKWSKTPSGGAYHVSKDAITGNFISHHHDGEQKIWDAQGNLLKTICGNEKKYAVSVGNHCCSTIVEGVQYIVSQGKKHHSITVSMGIGSADNVLAKLTLQQLLLIDDLISARAPEIQKDHTKLIELSSEQLELFRELPLFVQTALRINLNLAIPQCKSDKADQKNN
jgi:hypothetical protein